LSSKLGRNFTDLIKENKIEHSDEEKIVMIDIRKIRPNPVQPRKSFNRESLDELANSIKEHGVIQPVILKPGSNGYILVAGERRVRAAKIAELTKVPAIIRDYNSIYLAELAIMENLQREDLSSIEEALAFKNAIDILKLTHEELGTKIGKSRSYVTNVIGLLNLPASVIDLVNAGKISMGHARSLSKLKDQKEIVLLVERVIKENLTVRELESIIRQHKKNEDYRTISKELRDFTINRVATYLDNKFDVKINKNTLRISVKNETEMKKLLGYFSLGDDSDEWFKNLF